MSNGCVNLKSDSTYIESVTVQTVYWSGAHEQAQTGESDFTPSDSNNDLYKKNPVFERFVLRTLKARSRCPIALRDERS